MRKIIFAEGEYYHVYNRGVDKRNVVEDKEDVNRFFQSLEEFNTQDPIGSIYENSFRDETRTTAKEQLVQFVCYCLNPNHYHFLLKQTSDKGIEKFMHRFATGYTKYFNNKYQRTGALFQGPYKAIHVDSNKYLLYLSAYINLNAQVHQLGSLASKLGRSSWSEFLGKENKGMFCTKNVVLSQFHNVKEYQEFAEETLEYIREKKELYRELKTLLMEQ